MRQALLAALILSATGASMGPHRPMTSSDYFALQGREADRTVREDLLSLLVPVDRVPWTNRAPINIPVSIPVRTRPIGTSYPGTCQRTVLTIRYAAPDAPSLAGGGPIKPYQLDANLEFHVSRLPSAEETSHSRSERPAPSCPPSDLQEAGWFAAADLSTALGAARLVEEVAAILRSGRLKLTSCTVETAGRPSCGAALLEQIRPGDITMYRPCHATRSTACTSIVSLKYLELTVERKASDDEVGSEGQPDLITSVSVAPVINVT